MKCRNELLKCSNSISSNLLDLYEHYRSMYIIIRQH